MRAAQPAASTGTWLEQLWLRLGGAACVDATARANVDLFGAALTVLPGGEQDLPGPALDAALDKLTALPDPEANSDCGVQLMTIHKSKGLEFEVVIVPDLQAGTSRGKRKCSPGWNADLLNPDDSERNYRIPRSRPCSPKAQIAARPRSGSIASIASAKSQEDRRILYVAATRAREELHLFARPAYKIESNGQFSLADPAKNSLLATAWPALEDEVRERFEKWKSAREKSIAGEEQVIESIAAPARATCSSCPPPPSQLCCAACRRITNRSPRVSGCPILSAFSSGKGGRPRLSGCPRSGVPTDRS